MRKSKANKEENKETDTPKREMRYTDRLLKAILRAFR